VLQFVAALMEAFGTQVHYISSQIYTAYSMENRRNFHDISTSNTQPKILKSKSPGKIQGVKSSFDTTVSRKNNVLVPGYSPMHVQRKTSRWVFGGTNFTSNFQMSDGHNQFLVGTSTTTCSTYVDCWRIRRIRFYARNTEGGYPVQVVFTPVAVSTDNFLVGVPINYALESQSVSEAVMMQITPGREDPMGMWHRTSTTNSSANLFQLGCSTSGGSGVDQNTIMEIDFEYLLNVNGGALAYALTGLSGISLATLYGNNLFGGLVLLLDQNIV